ncbi:MAG TPA: monovalent cation/H+ antiporter subunit D family protein [Desulfonatronum sp.]|nr:monovalent cation/H+ antiporter subunit D family protein [Desulfonatronum sp.]
MSSSQIPVLIPVTFLLTALLIPLLGLINRSLAQVSAVIASGLALVFSYLGLQAVLSQGRISYHIGGWMPPLGIEFILDSLSAFLCVVFCGITLLVLIYGKTSVAHETPGKDIPFYSLTMLLLGGLSGMVMTGDLFNLYVFLEISALSGYALLGIGNRRASLAAFRYLTLGTAGASFYLLGLAFIFYSAGTLNMADLTQMLPFVQDTRPVSIGLVLMVLGVGLKMALFPMHAWLPDAYTYASSTATALIAPIGTKVAAYVLLRLMFFVADPDYMRHDLHLTQVVGYLGAIGIIWGSIMAICQKELKRMLAFSSVAQVGYIALGIGLASPLGFIGAVLHILNHACMKGCLFLFSGNLRLRLGHSTIPKFSDTLSRSMPWSSAAFALAAISMIGLPPTAGFFSKWYLALGSIEQSNWIFLAVLLVSSLLNAVYFFRIMEKIYLKPRNAGGNDSHGDAQQPVAVARNEAPGTMLVPTLTLAVGLLVLGIMNAWIITHVIHIMIPSGL